MKVRLSSKATKWSEVEESLCAGAAAGRGKSLLGVLGSPNRTSRSCGAKGLLSNRSAKSPVLCPGGAGARVLGASCTTENGSKSAGSVGRCTSITKGSESLCAGAAAGRGKSLLGVLGGPNGTSRSCRAKGLLSNRSANGSPVLCPGGAGAWVSGGVRASCTTENGSKSAGSVGRRTSIAKGPMVMRSPTTRGKGDPTDTATSFTDSPATPSGVISHRPPRNAIRAWKREMVRSGSGSTSVASTARPSVPPSSSNRAWSGAAGGAPLIEMTTSNSTVASAPEMTSVRQPPFRRFCAFSPTNSVGGPVRGTSAKSSGRRRGLLPQPRSQIRGQWPPANRNRCIPASV